MQRCVFCRSRREFSQEYLLAKIGVDTAENELRVNPNRVRVITRNSTRNYASKINYAYCALSGPRRDDREEDRGQGRAERRHPVYERGDQPGLDCKEM